jgi:hypothetical protein
MMAKKIIFMLFITVIVAVILILFIPEFASSQAPPPPPSKPAQAPVDGGLGLLAVAGGAYAIKKLRNRKKRNLG